MIDTRIGNNDTQTEKLEDKGLELPLPELCKGSSDREELVKEQRDDESLEKARELADKELERFGWKDGLLVHREDDIIGETRERIVVPTGRRREILKIAGHLSGKKTRGINSKCFTRPGMPKDVKEWCKTFPECQKAQKKQSMRAPLIPLPVIETPFHRVAFDLVGPLPRSKSGMKYILTSTCLASKYPEAIALRKVAAPTVAEVLMETFSRRGIPAELLTDQGTMFVGKLTSQLCVRH